MSAAVVLTGAVVFTGLAEIFPTVRRTVTEMEMKAFMFICEEVLLVGRLVGRMW
jgi:hypothetical protein